jgi:hypothetical protein
MKRLAVTALLALSLAPSAFAMSYPQLLPPSDLREIQRRVPGADLTNLTFEQAAALATALYSSEKGTIGAQIRAILN